MNFSLSLSLFYFQGEEYMETKKLFLMEGDTLLDYRSKVRKLRFINIKHNEIIKLAGNQVLTADNIVEIEAIVLIKLGKSVEIPLKKGSGTFQYVHTRYGRKKEKIARFEVDPAYFVTEAMIKIEFGSNKAKPPFKQKIQLEVNTT